MRKRVWVAVLVCLGMLAVLLPTAALAGTPDMPCYICGDTEMGYTVQLYCTNWHQLVCKRCRQISRDEQCSGGTATCTSRANCSKCGQEYGVLLWHNPSNAAKAATCTEIGWRAYGACTRCDYTAPYFERPALGHVLEQHAAKAATCTDIGWNAYDTCKRKGCGYTTYVEIPALGHNLEHHAAKAATCTEIGWDAYDTCKREGCGYSTYEIIPALGHDIVHHDPQAPTCTEIGWDAWSAPSLCTNQ